MNQLKHWRDLTPDQKAALKTKHNIKTVTFKWLCEIFVYNKNKS